MGFASFFGNSAQAFDKGLKEWQRLFLQEDQLEQQHEQFQTQMRQQRSLEERRMEHQTNLEALRQQGALDLFNKETNQKLAIETIDLAQSGAYNVADLPDLAAKYREMGGPFAQIAPLLTTMGTDRIYGSRKEALNYLASVTTSIQDPESSVPFNRQLWDAAVEMSLTGLGDAQRKERQAHYDELRSFAEGTAEELSDAAMQSVQNNLDQQLADIENTLSETDVNDAQAGWLIQQTKTDAWKTANLLPQQRNLLIAQTQNMMANTTLATIEADYKPALMAQELAQQELTTEEMTRTIDAVVDSAIAAAEQASEDVEMTKTQRQLLESDLRVSTATEMARIALKNGEVERLDAATEKMWQDIKESKARIKGIENDSEYREAATTELRQRVRHSALATLTEAAQAGNLDAVRDFGVDLLVEAGYSREDAEDAISDWEETTNDNQTRKERLADLEMRLATAETQGAEAKAEVAGKEAENYEEDRRWQRQKDTWEHELEERRTAAMETQAQAAATNAGANAARASAGSAPEPGDVGATSFAELSPDMVFDRLSVTGGQFSTMVSDFNESVTEPLLIDNVVNEDALSGEVKRKYDTLLATVSSYMSQAQRLTGPVDNPTDAQLEAWLPPGISLGSELGQRIMMDLGWSATEPEGAPLDPTNTTDFARTARDLGRDAVAPEVVTLGYEQAVEDLGPDAAAERWPNGESDYRAELEAADAEIDAQEREVNAAWNFVTQVGVNMGYTPTETPDGEMRFRRSQLDDMFRVSNRRRTALSQAEQELLRIAVAAESDPLAGFDEERVAGLLAEVDVPGWQPGDTLDSAVNRVRSALTAMDDLQDDINLIRRTK